MALPGWVALPGTPVRFGTGGASGVVVQIGTGGTSGVMARFGAVTSSPTAVASQGADQGILHPSTVRGARPAE